MYIYIYIYYASNISCRGCILIRDYSFVRARKKKKENRKEKREVTDLVKAYISAYTYCKYLGDNFDKLQQIQ
jgi:hypothetical protein